METLMEMLPIILPLFIIQLILMVTALVHVLRHPNYRFGSRGIWMVVVIVLQIIGPVLYFAIGRGEED
ncbi:MAG: PLD nuclease N-terminal domain-containing protein [Oscillospiraceae bacterium]|jgi:uncharacterized membrane protein YqjE|nr:PLD nuclease N-terminal domain-containing protein [Oscillospiraceae bacterium]